MARAARPFIKMVGGKTQLLPVLLPILLGELEKAPPKAAYHEPFLGGAAVFFGLRAAGFAGPAYLSDVNGDLINVYACVGGIPDKVAQQLNDWKGMLSEGDYYHMRRRNTGDNLLFAAARFIYLNKTCFNGLCRYNRKGEFNVPWGKYENPTIYDAENLRACCVALERATVERQDFTIVTQNAHSGDVAYLDPPYVPVNKTSSFTSYSKDGFTSLDQAKLEDTCRKLDRLGAKFVLSNSDCEETRRLYQAWNIREVTARRNVNSKGGRRGPVGELVVTNF